MRGGAPGKERASRVVFHPYPGVWLRDAIPVWMLAKPPATGHDMAAVANRSRPGYFLSLWGPFVPLKDVEAIGFEMEDPIGSPTLEVRSVRLDKTSPGDAFLDGLPLVDALGQYAHGSWPGKAGSVDDLQKAWRDELVKANPAMGVRPFPESPPRARVLYEAEFAKLQAAVDNLGDPHTWAAFRMLIETGARKSEVLRAKWEDVDLEAGTWRIPATVVLVTTITRFCARCGRIRSAWFKRPTPM